ncbi:MAG: DNA-binding transcriptional MerR regulator [Lentisphaeria bacterium]|jgi:DNA-binding transcriptional MerR regulator
MHIEQIAKITGVTVNQIRHYDSIGLLIGVEKTDGKHFYSDSHVHAIKMLKWRSCRVLDTPNTLCFGWVQTRQQ